jgi:hypothetical protein
MRRTALLVGTMLTALFAVSGAAWAVTTIYCSDPQNGPHETCMGTPWRDEIIGTEQADEIFAHTGNDVVRAGGGADFIDGEGDVPNGKDVNYGGPGKDRILGNMDPERHYGGSGDDSIADYYPSGNPDVIRCGRGYDSVTYNEGVDTVDTDCEVLRPYDPNPNP